MARLKKRYWILLSFLLIVILAGLFGWHYWQSFKQKNGISVDWQGAEISFDGISFDEFTFTKQSTLSVSGKKLFISWSHFSSSELDIHWQSDEADTVTNTEENSFEIASLAPIIHWLPDTLHVDSLKLYPDNNELVNLNVDINKNADSLQLAVATNDKIEAQLVATLAINQADKQIDIQNGLLTTKLNQPDLVNSSLSLPFMGWVKTEQFSLTSSDKAQIKFEKAVISPDFFLMDGEGQATLQVDAKIPIDYKLITLNGQLTVNKLNGIYKTSEIKSATGNSVITLKDNRLTVTIPTLKIKEVDPGILFNDVKLVGSYSAPMDSLDKGIIAWSQAQANLFSGSVALEKGKLNLAQLPQQLNVQIKQIQLKDILSTYPVEGLAGDGIIEGSLPITLSMTKKNSAMTLTPSIKNGQLVTVQAGYLQFENSALQNYVKDNPSMQIVTDILKNFHYTKLTGNVDYKNEIANLGLNIQGNNPDIEGGKPVNLNINIEENIPKLMMSLQLSDQISEPIRKRIEERLK